MISSDLIGQMNDAAKAAHEDDYASLGRQLARRGLDIGAATQAAMEWSVAVPTWGVGTGGTRFARFPGAGEPRHIHDKLADCGVIQALTRGTRTVSPHIPWDKVSDYNALRQEAASYGLGFDAVNSNTFQDQVDRRPRSNMARWPRPIPRRGHWPWRITSNVSRSAGRLAPPP